MIPADHFVPDESERPASRDVGGCPDVNSARLSASCLASHDNCCSSWRRPHGREALLAQFGQHRCRGEGYRRTDHRIPRFGAQPLWLFGAVGTRNPIGPVATVFPEFIAREGPERADKMMKSGKTVGQGNGPPTRRSHGMQSVRQKLEAGSRAGGVSRPAISPWSGDARNR